MADTEKSSWDIQRLKSSHDRTGFDCGRPVLNEWLQQFATQHEKRGLARTYVAAAQGQSQVAGYYAISMHSVRFAALTVEQAKGLPKIDVPVVLLARLAVDRGMQGQRLGSLLLIDCLRRAEYLSETIGVRAIEVHALDDAARNFYLKFGFSLLQDDPHHLYLPMQVIRKLGLPPLLDKP